MTDVVFEGVEKRFGEVEALHALDLAVPDGAFLVLLGPSGGGKTTALRILAGLEEPTAGRVLLGSQDVTRAQPRDRDVAMVFQSYALYPHMSVAGNIGYPLRIRRVGREERNRQVGDVADLLGLEHLLDRRPRQLSGGQRQRVALARAIVREPQAFLMDEPLSNLDARLRADMRGELKRLQRKLGTTTVYVTHDQVEAMTMADFVAILADGVLQQVGTPAEIYGRPANRFVATFVGSPPMNILEGDVDQDARAFAVQGATMPLPDRLLDACRAAGVTELGIRAEDVSLVDAGAPDSLPAEIYVVEPLGNETLVEVRVGTVRVTARAERGWAMPIGSAVGVRIEPSAASFFTADGAAAIHPGEVGTALATDTEPRGSRRGLACK
jgi:multiple sugar transport system ATP-binding protein